MIGEAVILRRRIEAFFRRLRIQPWMFTVLAMAVFVYFGWKERLPLFPIRSPDYRNALSKWYAFIQEHGFSAFGVHFYNYTYTPTYPYTFWVASQIVPWAGSLVVVKTISFVFDVFAATMAWALVRLHRSEPWPTLAFGAVIFWPTVILNGAAWGQCDVIYTSFLLAFLYFILTKRPLAACVMFGVAFSFKLQAGFIGPALLILVLRRQVSWSHLLAIPAVYVLLMVPAWLAGRPFWDLMMIYPDQMRAYQIISMGAPNMYQLLHFSYERAKLIGGVTAVGLTAALCLYASRKRFFLEGKNIVAVALVSVIMVPFALPKMMYRYFFAADLISIVFAFYFPRLFFVPILVQFASLYSYPRFIPMHWFPFTYLSWANLAALVAVVGLLIWASGFSITSLFRRKTRPVSAA